MLSFLRKIRKSLIESGSTKRYLLYAFGEIILVVLGILIALQVNNWNESRKQNNVTKSYLSALIHDFEGNVIFLKDNQSRIKDRMDRNYRIRSILSSPVATIDSLKYIADEELNFFIVSHNAFNNNTYQTLKNTGHLDYMDKWIQEGLQEIHFLEEDLLMVALETRKSFDDLMLSYKRIFPPSNHVNYSPELRELSWNDVSYTILLRHIEAITWFEGAMYASIGRRSKPLLEKYNSLLDTMIIEYPFLESEYK